MALMHAPTFRKKKKKNYHLQTIDNRTLLSLVELVEVV